MIEASTVNEVLRTNRACTERIVCQLFAERDAVIVERDTARAEIRDYEATVRRLRERARELEANASAVSIENRKLRDRLEKAAQAEMLASHNEELMKRLATIRLYAS